MGDLAFNVAGKLLEMLGPLVRDEICLACGMRTDLQKLRRTIDMLKAVLLDAEEKRSRSRELNEWLEQLKDAFYDAEDVLDEYRYQALHMQVVNRNGIESKVCNLFSGPNPILFRFKMGHKIKQVREKLDEIASLKQKFHLKERLDDDRRVMYKGRETHSFVPPPEVIGRDDDIKDVIKSLTSSDSNKRLSIIPIVGLGGLGKTTLARIVYNDDAVREHFHLKMWVCVSTDFDVARLTKEILISATGSKCDDLPLDQLQMKLRDKLENTKFLLVLDDVWSDDSVKWSELRSLLMSSANGSKIIVTTRSSSVAKTIGTVSPHNIEGLNKQDSLSLFKTWAFKEGEETTYPHLMEIGGEIVKKCKGVPLAIRTLGSYLRSKTELNYWVRVRDNEIWKLDQNEDGILPALRLSYNLLPSYLKPCFVYCSLFPKDYEFNGFLLIQLWMAVGLIQPSNKEEEMEWIGEQYIMELGSRSFFQEFENDPSGSTFKMHDLVHDLALSLAEKEYSFVNSGTQDVSEKVRHLSFEGTSLVNKQVPQFLNKLSNARTISFPKREEWLSSKSRIGFCISKFKNLRILDLHSSDIEMLSNSVGALKHLRYLDLSLNVEMKELPASICKLYSLQTLLLHWCWNLEKLPDGIQNLINLRCLWITTKEKYFQVNGIECLTSLRTLVILGCENLVHSFENMERLTALRTLSIGLCPRLTSLPNGMKHLAALEKLVIEDCEELSLGMDHIEYFDNLRLQYFAIRELPKLVELPEWLLQGSTSTLQSL